MNDRHKLFLGLLVILGTLGYGVFQWIHLSELKVQAQELQSQVQMLAESSAELAGDYQSLRKDVSEARATAAQEMDAVFPSEEDLSDLTRLLDQFSVMNNFSSNPFFITNLSYQMEQTPEGAMYRYVPLNLSLTTSKSNLNKFMEYIENSGSLEGQVRLMSIQNIRIGYPTEFGGTYPVQMDLNAYFAPAL